MKFTVIIGLIVVLNLSCVALLKAQGDSSDSDYRTASLVHVYWESLGANHGAVSAWVEITPLSFGHQSTHDISVATGIGTTWPFNSYLTVLGRYSYGRWHRIEFGIGPSFLLAEQSADASTPVQPLSNAPVNLSGQLGWRLELEFGLVLRMNFGFMIDSGDNYKYHGLPGFGFGFVF